MPRNGSGCPGYKPLHATHDSCSADLSTAAADLATCEADLAVYAACGNGVVDAGEQCDGVALDGATCATQSFPGGTLHCAPDCTFDTSSCWATRFVDNGDGTVTDNQTKLVWEKKTTTVGSGSNPADPQDVDNAYKWGNFTFTAPFPPNGNAFTDFLWRLNGSDDGVCFTGKCDWRIPTLDELLSIVDCRSGSPCIAGVFGPTVPGYYCSSSTSVTDPESAWYVNFDRGTTFAIPKTSNYHVRAVRGGS